MVRAIGSYPIGHKFESHRRYHEYKRNLRFIIKRIPRAQRPVGQAVKTPPFHGGNMGSSPVRVTSKKGEHQLSFFAVCFRRANPSGSEKCERLYASVFLCRGIPTRGKRQAPRTGHQKIDKFRQETCRFLFKSKGLACNHGLPCMSLP